MRMSQMVGVMLVGTLCAVPAQLSAQLNISVSLGKRLGPEISIFAYSQQRYGDWRVDYRQWTPVTIYDYNGHYYRHSVQGSRAIVVYSRNNEYFLPPPDQGWVGKDKRYNYKRQPDDRDRGRAKNDNGNRGNGRGNGKGNDNRKP